MNLLPIPGRPATNEEVRRAAELAVPIQLVPRHSDYDSLEVAG